METSDQMKHSERPHKNWLCASIRCVYKMASYKVIMAQLSEVERQ